MLQTCHAIVSQYMPSYKKNTAIIAAFGVLLLCLLWSSVLYKVGSEERREVGGVAKETANLALALEEHTLRTIDSVDHLALLIKANYEQGGRTIDILHLARQGVLVDEAVVLMSVIDEHGDLAVSSQVPFVPSNLADREHFLVHKSRDTKTLFISKPVLGRSSGKWSIQMTRRVNKPDGSFGGVVVVSVDPYYFIDFYKQVDLGAHSTIALVGVDGVVRAWQSGQQASVGQNLHASAFMDRVRQARNGFMAVDSPIDGVKRLISFRTLAAYPLVVAVGMEEAEALLAYRQRVQSYYQAAASVSGLILFFLLLLWRNARRQRQAEAALQASRDEMERQVQERTRDLSAANRRLTEEIAERTHVEAELRHKNETISWIAYTDQLTGLDSRTQLAEKLAEELVLAQRGEAVGAVFYMDLDDLKTVNDTFGHSYGDNIIVTAGARLLQAAGKARVVARIGGDEFVVLLPGVAARAALAGLGQQMIAALSRAYEVQENVFKLSASIGIAVYPEDGDTVEELLKNADNAMYAAKRAGKNGWRFYAASMQEEAYRKMLLTNSLHRAIERNELFLHYQPQVTVDQHAIVGFEALLRWQSAEHGGVSPGVFIPLAEQGGLIHSLGAWCLREACQFARRLAEHGLGHLYVAVNISAKQLAADGFVAQVQEAIRAAGIQAQQLELEITESALIHSLADATAILQKLRAMGVRLSLDDFGTGYSSLTYLRQLPVDTLKIDKSFIDAIEGDETAAKLIGAIIDMAHLFQMRVVAEGVETNGQLAYLIRHGCDYVQGYVFSRPVPQQEILDKFFYCAGRTNEPACTIYNMAYREQPTQ